MKRRFRPVSPVRPDFEPVFFVDPSDPYTPPRRLLLMAIGWLVVFILALLGWAVW